MYNVLRKLIVAVSLVVAAAPAFAAGAQGGEKEKCRMECKLLLEDCARESRTLPEKIKAIQKDLESNADSYSDEELRALRARLQALRQELRDLNRK